MAGILSGSDPTRGAPQAVAPNEIQMDNAGSAAWKSPDYPNIWFIAMRFRVDGVGELIGVWASNSLVAYGDVIIMAVDEVAQQWTVWPDADKIEAAIDKADRGVNEAKACLSFVEESDHFS